MDPDANLEEQRTLAARILSDVEDEERPSLQDASRLAELVQALDEWISKGGFLPKPWRR